MTLLRFQRDPDRTERDPDRVTQEQLRAYLGARNTADEAAEIANQKATRILRALLEGAEVEPGIHRARILEERNGDSVRYSFTVR